jgi:acetyl esterase/lipase
MPTPKDWLVLCSVMASTAALCFGQVTPGVPAVGLAAPAAASASGAEGESARHGHDRVIKAIDDLKWHLQLGAVAEIDRVTYTSAPVPRRGQANPTAPGAANPLIINAYTFIPKQLNRTRKQPLLVLVHGGVHANFNTGALHIVQELLEQGYTVLAPDYRGSTGYGRSFYEAIDYGGLENEDVHAGVLWMLEAYSFLDAKTGRHHGVEPRRNDHPDEHL